MTNRLETVILALAIAGFAGGALAQTSPGDGAPAAAPASQGPWRDGETPATEHQASEHHEGEGGWRQHGHHHWRHHRWSHRWAHRWDQRWDDRWGARHEGPAGQGAMLLRSLRTLNLTAAQQEQLHAIVSKFRERDPGMAAGGATDRMALANPGDPNYAAALAAAKKRAVDRIQEDSDLRVQLYNVLTPEQKAQLTKNLARWKARMAQREQAPKGPPVPIDR